VFLDNYVKAISGISTVYNAGLKKMQASESTAGGVTPTDILAGRSARR